MDTASRSMRWVLTAVVVLCGLVLVAVAPVAGAPAGGNSGNAKACQQGGYLTLQRADGTRFSNVGECVSYAAQGGVLMPIPTATTVPTPTNVPPTVAPPTPFPTIAPPTEAPTATDVPPTEVPPTAIPPTATDVPVTQTVTFFAVLPAGGGSCLYKVGITGFASNATIAIAVPNGNPASFSIVTNGLGTGESEYGEVLNGTTLTATATVEGISSAPTFITC